MGPTIEVRAMGRPGSAEAVIVSTLNQLAADLDFVVDKINTANGGTTGLPINNDVLLAGLISFTGAG